MIVTEDKVNKSIQLSKIDLGRPNPYATSDAAIDYFATRDVTQQSLQANDAGKKKLDSPNELKSADQTGINGNMVPVALKNGFQSVE